MANPRNGGGFNGGGEDQTSGQDSSSLRGVGVSGSGVELTERLTSVLVEEGDGDLLLQVNDREGRVVQWLQALDLQVVGACRADERLKPMLKNNASTGAVVEDSLLAHLSQHFEPSEVGLLARCLCIPLVSIRVGKVHPRGARLCPSDTRGNLNLTLLPTSDLRLSFIGDDGYSERLFTLHNKSQCSIVAVEEILADSTGRSFLVKTPDGKVLYFWFSEKSKLLGVELLAKMKDLLKRKPSIAELTGISEARLGCFATHLRAYLVGSTASNRLTSSAEPGTIAAESTHEPSVTDQNVQSSASTKCEGTPRNLSSVLNVVSEQITGVENVIIASPVITDAASSTLSENEKPQEDTKFSPTSFLESLGKFAAPPPVGIHVSNISSPLFSPYYCWCPPGPSSTLQYSAALPHHPTSMIESTALPPLSSLLPPTRSTFLSTPPLSLPQMGFPALFPDPMVRFPMPSSQHIPTFAMCDPIVHVPVIDVCSSGQGYLVSAGSAIPTTISPLHLNPVIREADSVMEKGARETLRMLLSASNQTATPQAQMMGVFPDARQGMVVTGSRGLYSGTRDVSAIAAMGLVPLPLSLGRCESSHNMPQESSESSEENMDP